MTTEMTTLICIYLVIDSGIITWLVKLATSEVLSHLLQHTSNRSKACTHITAWLESNMSKLICKLRVKYE